MATCTSIPQTWPRFSHPLNWQVRPQTNDSKVLPWLLDTGSLTHKLVTRAGDGFSIRRVAEGRQFNSPGRPVPATSPRRTPHSLYWHREVVLQGHGQPWVHALTLIPVRHRALVMRLRQLGDNPLGGFLFRQPGLQRLRMDFATMPRGQARRSWFRIDRQDIILVEVFLNEFLDTL